MKVRKALFSGSWYPASASDCEKEIQAFLKEKEITETERFEFKGGIVPHAGWYFSGSIACRIIKTLSEAKVKPDVIAIFGMHLHENSPPCIMIDGFWETPFGPISIASDLGHGLSEHFNFIIETHTDFTQDNTIELQLPFIKYFLGETAILPIGLPPSNLSLEIADLLVKEAEKCDLKLQVIGSTDLTHYGPNYGFTPVGTGQDALEWVRNKNDAKMINKILSMDPGAVLTEASENQNACCAGATAGAINAAKALGAAKATQIAYRTSNDKHPGSSFVGYTGILFQ